MKWRRARQNVADGPKGWEKNTRLEKRVGWFVDWFVVGLEGEKGMGEGFFLPCLVQLGGWWYCLLRRGDENDELYFRCVGLRPLGHPSAQQEVAYMGLGLRRKVWVGHVELGVIRRADKA